MKKNLHTIWDKFSWFLVVVLVSMAGYMITSCEQEDEYGTPVVTKVRIVAKDSAITEGQLGQMIVIQGRNLSSTMHIYFNNVEAFFMPTYVTDKNIIVTIPGEFPTEINNKITIVTKGGQTTYDFPVLIPPPIADTIPLEYVPDGEILQIKGRYFVNLEKVVFPGDIEGTIVSYTDKLINVKVPQGAQPGRIKVYAVAGMDSTDSWFRDNRNVFVNFDDKPICWGGDAYVQDPETLPSDFPVKPISGKFYYMKNDYGDNQWWIQESVIAYCGDLQVEGNPADYDLRFEMWVGNTKFDKNWFEVGMAGVGFIEWKPYTSDFGSIVYEKTGWITVSIPLDKWPGIAGNPFKLDRFGSWKSQVAMTFDFAFDNFRIVPKIGK